MHTYIILNDDIYTLDTREERADACDAMRELGVESLPILEGPAGEEGTPTGEVLQAAVEMPSNDELAAMLMALVNPESGEDERGQIVEQLAELGRVEVRDYRGSGVLTSNAGFVLTIGRVQFQISVVS